MSVVPPGFYALCAAGTAANHLMPCKWGLPYLMATVLPTATVSGLSLVVRNGAILNIQVTDTLNRILAPSRFHIGVITGNGIFEPAILQSQSAASYVYSVAVPKSTTLYLVSPITVADTLGNVYAPGRTNLTITIGQATQYSLSIVTR